MKSLRPILSTALLLIAWCALSPPVSAQRVLVDCATSTACVNGTGPYDTGTGDKAADAFGKYNSNFLALPSELFIGSPLAVTHGGSGIISITGLLQGNGASAFTAAATTGTGSVVYSNGAAIGQPSSLDCLNCTDVQPGAIVGALLATQMPGSAVRYPNSSTDTVTSADLGNIVNNGFAGTSTETLTDINTGGITPNGFQFADFNSGTGVQTIARQSTSTINGLASVPNSPGCGAIGFADANNSGSGNYNYTAFLTCAAIGASPWYFFGDTAQSGTNISDWAFHVVTGTNGTFGLYALLDGFIGLGSPVFVAERAVSGGAGNGIINIAYGNTASATTHHFLGGTVTMDGNAKSQAVVVTGTFPPASGQSWMMQPTSGEVSLGTGTSEALHVTTNQTVVNDAQLASGIEVGESYPAITWGGTGCTGQPTDTTGPAIAATFTNGSSLITGTNSFSAGQAVNLIGRNNYIGGLTVPAPYAVGTIYYVIAAGLSSSQFELSTTSGGSSVGNVTGTTATVTVAQSGNYLHVGGISAGNWTVPATGTYVAACFATMTFANPGAWGVKIRADDETANANLVQIAHTTTSGSIAKVTAVAPGDVISYTAVSY